MNRLLNTCVLAVLAMATGCTATKNAPSNQSEPQIQSTAVNGNEPCTKTWYEVPVSTQHCPPGETLANSGYQSVCGMKPNTYKKICFSCSLGTCGTACKPIERQKSHYQGIVDGQPCTDVEYFAECTCQTACGRAAPLSCQGWCPNNALCSSSCECPDMAMPDIGAQDIGMPDIAQPKDMAN